MLENEVTLETTKTSNIIIGVQSIRSITSINTIISWKFWNENAPCGVGAGDVIGKGDGISK